MFEKFYCGMFIYEEGVSASELLLLSSSFIMKSYR